MIHSLLTTENPINSTESLRQWIEQRNREVQVERIIGCKQGMYHIQLKV